MFHRLSCRLALWKLRRRPGRAKEMALLQVKAMRNQRGDLGRQRCDFRMQRGARVLEEAERWNVRLAPRDHRR